jgi:hypothetical protein
MQRRNAVIAAVPWALTCLCLVVATPGFAKTEYEEALSQRPMPSSEQERQKECGWIRQEMTRQRNIAAYSGKLEAQQAAQGNYGQGQLPSNDPKVQNMVAQMLVAQHLTSLQTRAANVGCRAAFGATSPSPTGMTFDQCFEKCKQLTGRSDTECIESCKR